MSDTPALEHLVGAYLHWDWSDDYSDAWDAVDDFVAGEPALAPRLGPEIDQLLNRLDSEYQVRAYLDTLLTGFHAEPEDGGDRAWLAEVARRVQAGLPPPHA